MLLDHIAFTADRWQRVNQRSKSTSNWPLLTIKATNTTFPTVDTFPLVTQLNLQRKLQQHLIGSYKKMQFNIKTLCLNYKNWTWQEKVLFETSLRTGMKNLSSWMQFCFSFPHQRQNITAQHTVLTIPLTHTNTSPHYWLLCDMPAPSSLWKCFPRSQL